MQNVLSEIVQWSENLPGWQRDELRRIFTTWDVTADDIEDLLDICKAAHGLASPRKQIPLSSRHVAIKESTAVAISLVSVTHHQGVNALATEQTVAANAG